MSRVCYVQGLSCLGLVCLGFVCLGLVMVLIIDYIRHFFQANTFTCKHTHTQTRPPTKTLFLWQKMPNSIFLVRKSCTLRLPPHPLCKKDQDYKFFISIKKSMLDLNYLQKQNFSITHFVTHSLYHTTSLDLLKIDFEIHISNDVWVP